MANEFDTERVKETIEEQLDVNVQVEYDSTIDRAYLWLSGSTSEVAKAVHTLSSTPALSVNVSSTKSDKYDVFLSIRKKGVLL